MSAISARWDRSGGVTLLVDTSAWVTVLLILNLRNPFMTSDTITILLFRAQHDNICNIRKAFAHENGISPVSSLICVHLFLFESVRQRHCGSMSAFILPGWIESPRSEMYEVVKDTNSRNYAHHAIVGHCLSWQVACPMKWLINLSCAVICRYDDVSKIMKFKMYDDISCNIWIKGLPDRCQYGHRECLRGRHPGYSTKSTRFQLPGMMICASME